jgi:hypothetical protein
MIDRQGAHADNLSMPPASRSVPVKSERRRKPVKQASRTQASNARLKKLAKVHRPPQEWFEQSDCPFSPAKS